MSLTPSDGAHLGTENAMQALRAQAEKNALSNTPRALSNFHTMPPETLREALHELEVHQIELEMQNEELRRTQHDLDAARARYFDLYDLAPIAYCTLDQNGMILESNLATANLLGIRRSDLFRQAITRFILKDDQDLYYLNSRKVTFVAPQAWEFRMLKNDGNIVWVHINISSVPDYNTHGSIFQATLTDISSLKHSQHQLRLSDAALKSISQGVIITSLDFCILSMNQAFGAITGYTNAEVLGRNCRFLQGPLTCPKTIEQIRHAIDCCEDFSGEILNYRKDQTPFWNDLTITPLRDEQGLVTHFIGIMRDISARKNIEQQLIINRGELEQAKQFAQSVTEHMFDGVLTLSEAGLITSANQACQRMFGYAADELIGQDFSQILAEDTLDDDSPLQQLLKGAGHEGIPYATEGRRKDLSTFPICISASRIKHAEQVTLIALVRDITQQQQNEEAIRHLAFYDALTNLPNRRLLLDRLHQAMLTSTRTSQHGALMFLDLDHFKHLNDTLGHDVGDELLRQVACRLQANVREGDSVARLGGDEFILLFEELSRDEAEAANHVEVIAHKILAALGQPYTLHEHNYSITPSIGIVTFMKDKESIADLLKTADLAMYQAKAAGRNTVRFFNPTMQAAAEERLTLEKELRHGLAENEFVLHYQTQVNRAGAITGVEALIRWHSPVRGLTYPATFIPIAEENGLIIPLGQWVLQTACLQLQAWASQAEYKEWAIAVNVSALQFAQEDFVETVQYALNLSGANPQLLKLELTESMLLNQIEDVILKMNQLRELGVSFSLDDFGTGYSSLAYLKQLPLQQLKIDQSFVRELPSDSNNATLAKTIITMGHSLGLRIIAEGVETAEQREFLLEAGCDDFQGYYFARPCKVESLPS